MERCAGCTRIWRMVQCSSWQTITRKRTGLNAMKIAVSACLLGVECRYDGAAKPCEEVLALGKEHVLIPVCPETDGGIRAPHPPNEIATFERAFRVMDAEGADNTDAFLAGAQKTLERVREEDCTLAISKAKSPSCGNGRIYDGTFTGRLVPGYGVAARLLRSEGIRVLDEQQVRVCLAVSAARHPGMPAALLAEASSECPTLSTERLLLRPFVEDDIQDVFAYCSDPDVGPDAGWAPHRTLEDARFFIEEIASAPHVFGVFERVADGGCGPCVGSIGLIGDPQRRNVDCLMLGYALAKQAWGHGYMTEASREVIRYGFEELGLSLITCTHYAFNDRSARVIKKCGFEYEGVLHAAEASPDGILQDAALYRLTAEAWRRGR